MFVVCCAVEHAEVKALKERKKKKRAAMSFGWEVFNTDSRYRAYKKQLSTLPGIVHDHTHIRTHTLFVGDADVCKYAHDHMAACACAYSFLGLHFLGFYTQSLTVSTSRFRTRAREL
jgi:hypothetical protein